MLNKISYIDIAELQTVEKRMADIQASPEPQGNEPAEISLLRDPKKVADMWVAFRDNPDKTKKGMPGKEKEMVDESRLRQFWEASKAHYYLVGGTGDFPAFERGWGGLQAPQRPAAPQRPFKQKWK